MFLIDSVFLNLVYCADQAKCLSDNIANSNTPGYKAKCLSSFSISDRSLFSVDLFQTSRDHFCIQDQVSKNFRLERMFWQ